MLFWSAARLGDVCAMCRRDVDLITGIWSLVQIKTQREGMLTDPLPIPLPRQAQVMLAARCDGMAADALVFTNRAGGKLQRWHQMTRRVQRVSGTTGWHRHDIRRSVATVMGDIGIPPHLIEITLGHKPRTAHDGTTVGRIAHVYNRSRYQPEHAAALQHLADELDRIELGEDNLVRLQA
jgi:integrase